MKIIQKRQKRNIWILAIAIAAVIIGLLITYFVLAKDGNFMLPGQKTEQDSRSTKQDTEDKGEIENTTNTPDKTTAPNSDQPAETKVDESSGKRIIPVVASATVDGNKIYIRGGLNTPETVGVCYAELSGPDNRKIRKDTTLLPSVSTTDCKTIIVPTSELTAGEWTYTLNFTSDTANGESNADTFIIN